MHNIQDKEETISTVETMIQSSDKGPSGFWTDDYEGCGNLAIFPEFEDGLKRGRLVQKKHYLCPWNTAVLYGSKYGNIDTGCYYSCSIKEVRYLTPQMLKSVLIRFKKRLKDGQYDHLDNISPLLTVEERNYIRKQKQKDETDSVKRQKEDKKRLKAAKPLLEKYKDNAEVLGILKASYGTQCVLLDYDGPIDFSPDKVKDVASKTPLDYNRYLDAQLQSQGKRRGAFESCYYNFPSEFKGRIEQITGDRICFERIFVTGMYRDDCSFFDGKEDHVWMERKGFDEFDVGTCVSFCAEIYRYIKTGRGKMLDYGLRNPSQIERIAPYQLPTDDELLQQGVNELICETCYLGDQCDRILCMRSKQEIHTLRKQMTHLIKVIVKSRPGL